jgi:hypothetical protein
MPQQAPQLGAYVFARSPRSKRIRFAAGAQAAGSVALRQGEFVKDNAIAAAKKTPSRRPKKSPSSKAGATPPDGQGGWGDEGNRLARRQRGPPELVPEKSCHLKVFHNALAQLEKSSKAQKPRAAISARDPPMIQTHGVPFGRRHVAAGVEHGDVTVEIIVAGERMRKR